MTGYTQEPDQVKTLVAEILHHRQLYYGGTPAISDQEYDQLEAQLQNLSPDHPVLKAIGAESLATSPKVAHDIPMLSLQKVYDLEELKSWRGDQKVIGMSKLDGNSLSLIYEKGRLVLGKTRGNGRTGEDVTTKALWVADIPHHIADSNQVEIRGELCCSETQFASLTQAMSERQLEKPTSPRNIVAGLLGRKTHWDLARFFNFIAFDLFLEGQAFDTEFDRLQWLRHQGFSLPNPQLIESDQQLESYLTFTKDLIENGDLGMDGAVFVLNDVHKQNELGNTAHHPRFKISYKWQGKTAQSKILRFSWQTSRHGIITPVAIIDPVVLSGATITNVTLHNAAYLKTYDLKPGDTIEIVRSGEVIPKFLQVVARVPGDFSWLDECPSCQGPLEFDGIRLRCLNIESCPAQHSGTILNWIRSVEIEDLSEKRLEALLGLGLIKTIPDLYRLTLDDLLQLPLTKEKMATKLLKNIDRTKSVSLERFLTGLGIPGMGITSWEKLISAYGSLSGILSATAEQIATVEGFADKTSQVVFDCLRERQTTINELLSLGIEPCIPSRPAQSAVLEGKSIAITGKLNRPRQQISKLIREAGGKVATSVSSQTDAVITDDPLSNSSKMSKAREWGVEVWSEEDFLKRINAENQGQ